MVIAHREELISQAADKIYRVTDVAPAIEMAESRAEACSIKDRSPVVVASIQTLNSGRVCKDCEGMGCGRCVEGRLHRMLDFDPLAFGLLVIDEAHHAVANGYRRVIDYFTTRNPAIKVLGVTATPDRTDEEALGQVFESVAFDYELPDAIRDGWLVPIEQQWVVVEGLDLSKCKLNAQGDLQDKDVAEAMRVLQLEGELHKIVHPTIELAGDAPTLVFAASVAHAESMAEIFNRHRTGSAVCLSGGTPNDERRDTLRRFANGDFQYLCNCALFLEGFDETSIACVAMARPTKSRALYAQCVGRGTRPLPGVVDGLDSADARRARIKTSGKPSLLVLDFVGNSGRHKLVSTADILAGQENERVIERAVEIAKSASANGEKTDMLKALAEARKRMEQEARDRRKHIVATAKYHAKAISPFDVFDIVPTREPGWFKGKKPTERQQAALLRFGVDQKQVDGMSYWDASQMMDALVKRIDAGSCSYKQAKILTKYGESADVTFKEASALIDRIAKNGWQPLPKHGDAWEGE